MSPAVDYPILIFWSDEDNAYLGVVPDLEGCLTHGRTPEEALAKVQVVKEDWLATTKKHGFPIPAPTLRPTVVPAAS